MHNVEAKCKQMRAAPASGCIRALQPLMLRSTFFQGGIMLRARVAAPLAVVVLLCGSAAGKGGIGSIAPDDLRTWLTYLSSDELEGRATFSEGLGLAAVYLADELKTAGVKPGGDNGSYFQRVKVLGIKSTPRSTVTVEVNGRTRTFTDGEGIEFPTNVGGARTLMLDQIEFVGYGLNVPAAKHNDYEGRDIKGKAVVWLGAAGPKSVEGRQYRRPLGASSRHRFATAQLGALASIGPDVPSTAGGRGGQPAATAPSAPRPDFTTAQRLDPPLAPTPAASDEFFEFLFADAPTPYHELKAKATAREPLPAFTLKNARLTFNLDAGYEVIRTQYTRNVIGSVEGTDPRLKETYVAFGAHYDHSGYSEAALADPNADRILNGADDDGSGTVTLLAVARAFAQGDRPKRSLIFVWHAGEERGLWGSRYYADYPSVGLDKIVAHLNMDMVGRNRDDKAEEANSVYPVGSDRISTELHNILIDANARLGKPLKLDFELNDPTDLEEIYYRSDHYSYAAKGIPVIFFTTGLHADYHRVSDTADKIAYEKMARIGQLVYETGARIANLDHAPVRDNKGPRAGKNTTGR
jgi:hypothetical protein